MLRVLFSCFQLSSILYLYYGYKDVFYTVSLSVMLSVANS